MTDLRDIAEMFNRLTDRVDRLENIGHSGNEVEVFEAEDEDVGFQDDLTTEVHDTSSWTWEQNSQWGIDKWQ